MTAPTTPPTDPPGRSPRCDAGVCTHVTCRWERGEDHADAVRAYVEGRGADGRRETEGKP